MDSFAIEYLDGRMIVTHLSGVINEYGIVDLLRFKAEWDSVTNGIDLQQEDLDEYIANCQSSVNIG